MSSAALAASPAILYVGGDPALDLINTVDWTSRGPEEDRLQTYDQVSRWAEGAGVISPSAGRQLRRDAAERPEAAAAAAEYTRDARQSLRDLFIAIARGQPTDAALPRFNLLLAETMAHLKVAPEGGSAGPGFAWSWPELESNPRAVVWPVIWSAARLLASDEIGNVRVCAGDDCGWMYVDRSRNGLRRWCQMRTCGTREKSRRRRGDGTS